MNDSELAALSTKLNNIAQTLAQAKQTGQMLNEAQTEFIVLDPLLQMLGYAPLEISKQEHNTTTGAKPDYTILPNMLHTWFLEGKKLDLTLTDGDAAQAVNYAHNHGARWAVLTNGRAWRIYDAHSPQSLPDKKILQIADIFADPNAASVLALLSRDAMCGGGILAAQALQQLNIITRRELETPHSNLRKSLQDTVQTETGGVVSDEAIGAALATLLEKSDSVSTVSDTLPIVPSPVASSPDVAVNPVTIPSGWYTLEQLSANVALVTGRKPARVSFGEGETVNVKSWKGVLQFGIDQIGKEFGLPPIPFSLTGKSKKYLLNNTPLGVDGKPMVAHMILNVAEQNVVVDTNLSAQRIVRALLKLIDAVGAPFNCMQVELEVV